MPFYDLYDLMLIPAFLDPSVWQTVRLSDRLIDYFTLIDYLPDSLTDRLDYFSCYYFLIRQSDGQVSFVSSLSWEPLLVFFFKLVADLQDRLPACFKLES